MGLKIQKYFNCFVQVFFWVALVELVSFDVVSNNGGLLLLRSCWNGLLSTFSKTVTFTIVQDICSCPSLSVFVMANCRIRSIQWWFSHYMHIASDKHLQSCFFVAKCCNCFQNSWKKLCRSLNVQSWWPMFGFGLSSIDSTTRRLLLMMGSLHCLQLLWSLVTGVWKNADVFTCFFRRCFSSPLLVLFWRFSAGSNKLSL